MTTDIIAINELIKKELANEAVMNALVETTFKGLTKANIYLAIREGMLRDFTFENFLKKDVYAIPFMVDKGKPTEHQEYSLITSIDYARKKGMRNGVVGKSAPVYEFNDGGKVISCEITIKRKVEDYVGEYTAKVYFDEYNTGRNLWLSKPKTMLAKVAEMHALRAACPEELSQVYVEEEFQQEARVVEVTKADVSSHKEKLEAVKSSKELETVWAGLPGEAKIELKPLQEELKAKFSEKKDENA